jgi:hypothetical protein
LLCLAKNTEHGSREPAEIADEKNQLTAPEIAFVRVRCVWLPQPTKWQHIGNQTDATTIFARSDLVILDLFDLAPGGLRASRR